MKAPINMYISGGYLFKRFIVCVMTIGLALSALAAHSSSGVGLHDGSSFASGPGYGKPRPIRVLMVGGGSSHDFNKWYRETDASTLREGRLATVIYIDHTDSIMHYLPRTDVLFLCNNQPISDQQTRQAIMSFVARGKGLVLAHAAIWYNWKDWPEYNRQLAGGGSNGHDPYGPFRVTLTGKSHPVIAGLPESFLLSDERYYYLPDPAAAGIETLATASAETAKDTFPSIFVVNHFPARIVGIALGHDGACHDLPAYRTLIRNAVKWAAKRK